MVFGIQNKINSNFLLYWRKNFCSTPIESFFDLFFLFNKYLKNQIMFSVLVSISKTTFLETERTWVLRLKRLFSKNQIFGNGQNLILFLFIIDYKNFVFVIDNEQEKELNPTKSKT